MRSFINHLKRGQWAYNLDNIPIKEIEYKHEGDRKDPKIVLKIEL